MLPLELLELNELLRKVRSQPQQARKMRRKKRRNSNGCHPERNEGYNCINYTLHFVQSDTIILYSIFNNNGKSL